MSKSLSIALDLSSIITMQGGSPVFAGGGGAVETQDYSLHLDGASDRLQIADITASMFQDFTADQDWTLKFSIKLDALNSTISATGPVNDYIWIGVNASGDLYLNSVTGVTYRLQRLWDTGLSIDTWYEIVITCDASGTNRALVCYVDKVAQTATVTSASTSSTSLMPASGRATWGSFFNIVDFDFRIDSIASWSSVLTSAEVTELYDNYPDLTADSGNYGSSADLTSYYKFEEGTGSTVADSSGNANDIVLINSPTWSSDTRI
jgi:hypothetical protein